MCKGAKAVCLEHYPPHGMVPPYWLFDTNSTTASGTVTHWAEPVRAKLENGVTYTAQVRAVSGEGGNLAAAEADVWLVRAGIEGSRRFALGPQDEGVSVTPSFELAVRRDGGDAETGMGADMGGGLAVADAANGLVFDSRARALVAHEAEGFREWGAALSLGWDPSPETGRGLSLTLTQSWGASASGGMEALLSHETLAGLAPAERRGWVRGVQSPGGRDRLRLACVRRRLHRHAQCRLRAVGRRCPRLARRLAARAGGRGRCGRCGLRDEPRRDAERARQ